MPSNNPTYMRKQMGKYRAKWDAEGKCKRCGKPKAFWRKDFKLCDDCQNYLNGRKNLNKNVAERNEKS